MSERKADARDARLSLRKTNEEVMRKQFQRLASKNCQDEIASFGKCAEENGLWVVLNCRSQSVAMNRCMDKFYTEELFQQYLKEQALTKS